MKKFAYILLLVPALLVLSCNGSKKSRTSSSTSTPVSKSSVNFVKSNTLSDVLDEAGEKNKLVFVDFYTTWCTPCKLMDQDVFTDKKVKDFFDDNFISYKVNAEKGNGVNLATVFEVRAYPTLLFLNEKGQVVEKKEGALYPTGLLEMARRAIDKHEGS